VAKKGVWELFLAAGNGREPISWERPHFFEAFPKIPVYIFCKPLTTAHTFV
jgi:hypothetical protein